MRYISITFFCFYCLVGFSQNYGDFPKIKKDQLLRDFDLVYQALDQLNVLDSTLFGRGIIPDYEVIQTFEEFKSGKNSSLNFILNELMH